MISVPLTAFCPYRTCQAAPGRPCITRSGHRRQPHASRARDALAIAAHWDPALDAVWPAGSVPCGICGTPGLPQRHRVIDAIAGRLVAGEDPDVTADDYGLSGAAAETIAEWMKRWPGAWC
jgi:hypothetical protein